MGEKSNSENNETSNLLEISVKDLVIRKSQI